MWVTDAMPNVFDCRTLHGPSFTVWSGVCGSLTKRYEYHQHNARKLRWVASTNNQPNASRMLEQMSNATVAIVGASHEAALFCALVCWFVSEGAQLDAAWQRLPFNGSKSLLMRMGTSHMYWMIPPCLAHGGLPCSMGARAKEGVCFDPLLKQLAEAARARPILVLHNACGQYAHSPEFDSVSCAMRKVKRIGQFHAMHRPLSGMCSLCGEQQSCNKLEDPASQAPPAEDFARFKDATQRWHHWRNASLRAVARLREVDAAGCAGGLPSRGVLLNSQPAHFPEVFGAPWAADGEGSYERFIANGLAYAHRVLHRRNGSAAFLGMGFAHLAMSTYAQGAGNFDASVALGVARAEAPLACEELSPLDCLNRHEARKIRDPRDLRSKYRLRTCEPRTGATTQPNTDWLHRAELEVATAARVPLLDSFKARLERWDVHPGIQGSGEPSALRNTYDCSHSSFVPGAYDGELTALQHLLDNGLLSRARCEGQ